MLLFVVARTRLDRYEELRQEFKDWRDVRIILDRREGERRILNPRLSEWTGGDWSDGSVAMAIPI